MQDTQQDKSYAQAAGLYGDHAQKHTPDQRELEARVLLKSAKFMQDLQGDWANINKEVIEETLKYNRQIWMMFYDTAIENPDGNRPDDLRSNIINLANFIFKRELEILSEPKREKFDVLININREIAAGLMTKQEQAQKAHVSSEEQADVQHNSANFARLEEMSTTDIVS